MQWTIAVGVKSRTANYSRTTWISNYKYLSMLGTVLFSAVTLQLLANVAVCSDPIADVMLIPIVSSEGGMDGIYADDFFELHEQKAGYAFTLAYLYHT